jgi:hypothetical protein
MNCQPQKEISAVAHFPNKELGCAFGASYNPKKSGKKNEKKHNNFVGLTGWQ